MIRPEDIKLKRGCYLIQPISGYKPAFTTEQRKYDRKTLAQLVSANPEEEEPLEVGDTLIYDDSHSIDFNLEGIDYSIIKSKDIVGVFKEAKNG